MQFNLVEIRENNNLQVRYLVEVEADGFTARKYHRTVTNSTDPNLSNFPQLVQDLAAAFPYIPDQEHTEGVHVDVTMIRIMASSQTQIRYDVVVHVNENGGEWSERKPPVIVHCLDDITQHPQKVQDVAAIIFTDEVKAAALAEINN